MSTVELLTHVVKKLENGNLDLVAEPNLDLILEAWQRASQRLDDTSKLLGGGGPFLVAPLTTAK